MKNLLAIDTSGAVCAVGLVVDGNRFLRSEHVSKLHNERLLPLLTELRDAAGLSQQALLERLDAVAFGRGPGSFTGVRIAAAAAQAIALACGGRIIRVATSEVLAQAALAQAPEAPGVVTSIRSRRDLHYLATYRNEGGAAVRVETDALHGDTPPAIFFARHAGWLVAGEVPAWWHGDAPVCTHVDAEALLIVGERLLARGEHLEPAEGLPEYLDGDSPWRKAR